MLIINKSKQAVQIDRFRILKPLGKGGFGTVYHVKDTQKSKSEYALKLLHNSVNVRRINKQLEVFKILNSSELFLKIYLSKRVSNSFFILFEYADEGNLKEIVNEKPLDESSACGIILELLESLIFLENHSIVHGDIKPENILKKGSKYYLSDWDVIKRGDCVPTLHIQGDDDFSAPEIYKGLEYRASDIYSLGCTLYYLLTAKHIYDFTDATDFSQKMFAHLYKNRVPHANISSKMMYLISRMTDKNHITRANHQEIKEIIFSQNKEFSGVVEEEKADNFTSKFERYLFMAKDGISYAQNIIGLMYEEGTEIDKDLKESFFWYEKSASLGLNKAVFNLALSYKNAKGCKQDYKKAMNLFMKSASQNHARSFYHLADMYENSLGVKKDMKIAYEFYKKAAYNGYKPAYIKLGEIA
ncbi:protein kinase [bacterium]|nr:protein kinase [bacterium]MBU1993443.1 protein kinase [bacterium]